MIKSAKELKKGDVFYYPCLDLCLTVLFSFIREDDVLLVFVRENDCPLAFLDHEKKIPVTGQSIF